MSVDYCRLNEHHRVRGSALDADDSNPMARSLAVRHKQASWQRVDMGSHPRVTLPYFRNVRKSVISVGSGFFECSS